MDELTDRDLLVIRFYLTPHDRFDLNAKEVKEKIVNEIKRRNIKEDKRFEIR